MSQLSLKEETSLHTLMSRTGSFPIGVARAFLEKYGAAGKLVLDPFCGRGTTLLAARSLDMRAYGVDVAPEAVLCSSAKLVGAKRSDLLTYISGLPASTRYTRGVPEGVKVFLHPKTLRALLPVRQQLLSDLKTPEKMGLATVTLTALMGILHGHASYSLSLPSAHAFSMSPGYVERYAERAGLKRPIRDVRECLAAKITRCIPERLFKLRPSAVAQGSAMQLEDIFPKLRHKIDVILTSPPYLQAQTYFKDNWLRHWLLDTDRTDLAHEYLQTSSHSKYSLATTEFFTSSKKMLRDDGTLICIAGDVRSARKDNQTGLRQVIRTIDLLKESAADAGFVITESGNQLIPYARRYLHSLSQLNGHQAIPMAERFFVARKALK